LVGYYISEESISRNEIWSYLRQKLPVYMIPNYFIKIETIPMTNNGKLDRRALPEPNINDIIKEEYVESDTEMKRIIGEIYKRLFKLKENTVGKYSDFYDLGGNSLNAIKVFHELEKKFKIKVGIKDILKYSMVRNLSKYIEEIFKKNEGNENEKDINEEIIKKCNMKEFPITSQQLSIYIDSKKNINSIMYNIPASVKLNEGIDIEKVKEAFNKLFNKHEILKTRYIEKEIGNKIEIYGSIDDEIQLTSEEYTYENAHEFVRPFNLSDNHWWELDLLEMKY